MIRAITRFRQPGVVLLADMCGLGDQRGARYRLLGSAPLCHGIDGTPVYAVTQTIKWQREAEHFARSERDMQLLAATHNRGDSAT